MTLALAALSLTTAAQERRRGFQREAYATETPMVHDPVMAREGDTYYIYATGMGIQQMTSRDRKTWTVLVNMLYTTSGMPVLGTKNIGTRYYLKCYTRNNSVVDKIEGYAYLQRAKVTGTEGNLSQGSWFFQGDGAI